MTNWLSYHLPAIFIATSLIGFGVSPNIAGVAIRASVAALFTWAGVIDVDTYRAIAVWSAWT